MNDRLHCLLLSHYALTQTAFQPLCRKSLSCRQPCHSACRLLYFPLGQGQPSRRPQPHRSRSPPFDAQPRCRLIKQVYRLIRQKTGGKIPHRKPNRRLQRLIGDEHFVVLLISRTQSLHDCQRLLLGRFLYQHALKASCQCAVLFNGLAVFRNGGGANDLQFSARQLRLHHISGVHSALRRADPHNGMDLINKQNDISCCRYLLNDRTDPFFKVAAVLGSSYHCRKIQRHNPFFRQCHRDSPLRNALRKPFYHRCFTNACLTDQAGIIFGTTGKNLQKPLGLPLSPDNRVESPLPCLLSQLPAKAIQHHTAGLTPRLSYHLGRLAVAVLFALFQAYCLSQGKDQVLYINRELCHQPACSGVFL